MITEIKIKTKKTEEIIDITDKVNNIIKNSDIQEGLCIIFVPHTTAGITINENADPAVKRDVLKIFNKFIPLIADYEHIEGNSAAHAKSIITGFSQTIFIKDNELLLGTWQGLYFCEYDGPRNRKIYVKLIAT